MSLVKSNGGGLGGSGSPGGSLGSFYSHTLDQSLRFNRDDTPKFVRDPLGSATQSTKSTVSVWFKRSGVSTSQTIFAGETGNVAYDLIQIGSDGYIKVLMQNPNSYGLRTSAFIRDPSAWYHLVCECDTTLSTAADRLKIYVNGDLQTLTSVYGNYPQDHAWYWSRSGASQNVGRSEYNANSFDGYLAEFNFIDGQALDPTSFGETKDGVWIPKEYSGSYGNNGFYLPFANAASSGASAFFSDSGNSYVEFSNATHYDIGSSDDFTIECFFNMTATGVADYSYLLGKYQSSSDSFAIQYSNSANAFYFYYNTPSFGSFGFTFSSGDVVAGKWHHLAINRASGNLDAFLDGTRLGGNQTSNTTSWTAQSAFRIGLAQTNGSNGFDGYISNVRMVVGSAVYSSGSSITVPTSTLTAVTNTKLLALTTSTMTADGSSNNVTGTLSGSGYFGTSDFSPFATFNFNDDQSGNANNFVANNVFPHDVVLDSPTNNFSTMNPIYHSASQAVLLDGNLKVDDIGFSNAANGYGAVSTFVIPKDKKIYIEVVCTDATGANWFAGFASQSGLESGPSNTYVGGANSITVYNRQVYVNGTEIDYGGSYGLGGLGSSVTRMQAGDILGCMCDGATGKVWFSRNGSYFMSPSTDNSGTTGDPAGGNHEIGTITNGATEDIFLVVSSGTGASATFVNFGQDSQNVSSANADGEGIGTFEYAPPTGYVALCSANLTTGAISPTQSSQADDHFNTVLYTGNGSTQSITGVGFQPDWTWLKSRSAAQGHNVFDVIRGANKALFPSDSNAEFTDTDRLNSFDSDGFSLGADANINTSSATYVSWNWKAGGAPSADNSAAANAEPTAGSAKIDGSNKSGAFSGSPSIAIKRLSANTTAGFSIVRWTGTGSAGTIPHGLGATPEFIFVKNLDDGTKNWNLYPTVLGNNYLELNGSGSSFSGSTYFNNTAPTANVFSVGTAGSTNNSSDDFIAYVFAPIAGYSKFASYVGNGSADGPMVHLGHRPAWILVKNASASGAWYLFDVKRNTYNVMDKYLRPNLSNAEGTLAFCDFVSNGFKIRSDAAEWNGSGNTIIVLSFAEAPFKFANAR